MVYCKEFIISLDNSILLRYYLFIEFYYMIKSFRDKDTEALFNRIKIKKIPVDIQQRARKKLLIIHFAVDENDLNTPPGNHFEKLKGSRKDLCSIRINDQWRSVFICNGFLICKDAKILYKSEKNGKGKYICW